MHHARRRRTLATALLTAAAVLVGGCAGDDGAKGKGAREPALGPVAENPAGSALSLPLDAYTDSDAEALRMEAVQNRLIGQCMARYGFTYEPPAGRADAGAGPQQGRHAALFGVADPAQAAARGYADASGAGDSAKPAPPQLTGSATAVLFGTRQGETTPSGPDPRTQEEAERTDSGIEAGGQRVPAGGCLREGYRKLYAPTKDSVDLLFSFGLASEAHTRSQKDSRVVAVLKDWSACMDEAGYGGVGTPYDVVEKLGLEGDEAGPKAVAVAGKDVACKREVNLVGVWAAVETAYQQRLVEENAETLALYKKQRDARFKLAASLA
ncbi:hypothetical protein ABT144_12325 [Streptomyces sp. NPDC002039]|uniref:hypothetical protein n=1 Tax=Streptomyces sp. NPDC002039 TaxID=3154660 RepID=UPI003331CA33